MIECVTMLCKKYKRKRRQKEGDESETKAKMISLSVFPCGIIIHLFQGTKHRTQVCWSHRAELGFCSRLNGVCNYTGYILKSGIMSFCSLFLKPDAVLNIPNK